VPPYFPQGSPFHHSRSVFSFIEIAFGAYFMAYYGALFIMLGAFALQEVVSQETCFYPVAEDGTHTLKVCVGGSNSSNSTLTVETIEQSVLPSIYGDVDASWNISTLFVVN
jgi:hypothetical protein